MDTDTSNASKSVFGESPLASVVIPTYNRAALVVEAIESCLQQTHRNLEVIVVDDGSIDDTEERVRQLAIRSGTGIPIRYYKVPNRGVSAARQFGLEQAGGDFVQYLDSDDVIFPDKIRSQVAVLQSAGAIVDACSCYGRKGPIERGPADGDRIGFKGCNVADYVRSMCSAENFPMASLAPLWRRDFLRRGPTWPVELTCGEDWCHFTELLLTASGVTFIEEELFWARDHAGTRLSKSPGREVVDRQALSFAAAIRRVAEAVRGTHYFDAASRAGLLKISTGAYLGLLEAADRRTISDFERFVLDLGADSPGCSNLALLIRSRRIVGRRVTLQLARAALRIRSALR